MRLRTKFSLLLSGCAVLSVFFSALAQSRAFTADQEAYLSDLQSNVALFIEKQLTFRMMLLHSRFEAVPTGDVRALRAILASEPSLISVEIWNDGKLLQAVPNRADVRPPPVGNGTWALMPSPLAADRPLVRWIGRYDSSSVVLDLRADWINGIMESSHGATSQILAPDGTPLISSEGTDTARWGADSEGRRELISKQFAKMAGMPQTGRYSLADGPLHLGTFLKLASDPPLLVLVTTPWQSIQAVIWRTYKKSAWTALVFLILAILIGVAFSSSLTSQLQDLANQTKEVARGNFNAMPNVSADRGDEVGMLARSFNQMRRELQKTQEDLKRSERLAALGKFSSSMAHEIKNPLSGILGNTQVAKRGLQKKDPKEFAAIELSLDFVEEEAKRANRIVNQLMKFARREKPPVTTIDLTEKVKRSVAIMAAMVTENGVELQMELSEVPLRCLADGDQIQEVLANLIQNAVHAVKESAVKKVSVSLKRSGDSAVLSVTDYGHGMAPEVKQHLFEPFFTTKPVGQGTGLGLAVCHGIIAKHNGSIDVQSEVGKGTTFQITLPLAAELAVAA